MLSSGVERLKHRPDEELLLRAMVADPSALQTDWLPALVRVNPARIIEDLSTTALILGGGLVWLRVGNWDTTTLFQMFARKMGANPTGGARGLRDEGLLDSALARPQNILAYYPAPAIAELAAAYAFGLAKNHAFVDGNKRIAFAAADVFLRINGWRLQRPPMRIHEQMMQMFDAGTFEFERLESWLREFAAPMD